MPTYLPLTRYPESQGRLPWARAGAGSSDRARGGQQPPGETSLSQGGAVTQNRFLSAHQWCGEVPVRGDLGSLQRLVLTRPSGTPSTLICVIDIKATWPPRGRVGFKPRSAWREDQASNRDLGSSRKPQAL